LDRAFKGRQRILRRVARSAPVRDDPWLSHELGYRSR
jgi:hypothetical protein